MELMKVDFIIKKALSVDYALSFIAFRQAWI